MRSGWPRDFCIPRRTTRVQGNQGGDGIQGIQGLPGEVTAAQLTAAIATTSANTNAVATMDTAFSNDPASLADMELMRAKYNELVLALRRL